MTKDQPLSIPETQEIASGPGLRDCVTYYVNESYPRVPGPIIGTAQTQNETHRIYVEGNPVLLRLQKVLQRNGRYDNLQRNLVYDGIPIADHQVYVHGTIERESPMGKGMNYSVRPISKDSELARKVIDCARQLFPSFSGELVFY